MRLTHNHTGIKCCFIIMQVTFDSNTKRPHRPTSKLFW